MSYLAHSAISAMFLLRQTHEWALSTTQGHCPMSVLHRKKRSRESSSQSQPTYLLSYWEYNICVPEALPFYPFRATFDFECFFDGENLPADSDRVQWIARHVPLSVSLASNIPGYETPRCYVTEGDSDKLVADMMAGIFASSDAAYDLLKPSYGSVLAS